MQHYGAPTRLLDFTYSIDTAAYFATEKASGTSAVWAVNGEWARKRSIELFKHNKNDDRTPELLDMPFDENYRGKGLATVHGREASPTVCSINPFRLNERLRIQRGVFLAPGDVNSSFMTNLRAMRGYNGRENLIRI